LLDFSPAERDFYDAIFFKSKTKFDSFCAKGNLLSNYASIFQLLMRLRQACDHPFLVLSKRDSEVESGKPEESKKQDDFSIEELENLVQTFVRAEGGPSQSYAKKLIQDLIEGEDSLECPFCLQPLVILSLFPSFCLSF